MSIVKLLLLISEFSDASCIELSQLLGDSTLDLRVVFGLEGIFEALENPSSSGLKIEHTVQIRKIISDGRLVVLLLRNLVLVLLHLLLHFVHHRVVDGLVRFLVGETEPSTVEFTLLGALSTSVEFLDRQQYHGAWLLDSAQRYLDFLVIVNLQDGVSNIVQIEQCAGRLRSALGVDFGQLLALFTVDDCFWVVLGNGCLVEGIVGSGEA